MTELTCEFPVTVEISGDPATIDPEAVGRAVEDALVIRLREAQAELATRAASVQVIASPSAPVSPVAPAPSGTPPALAPEVPPWSVADDEVPGISELAMLSTALIRDGYIKQVAGVIGPGWRAMSQAELTAFLTRTYSEPQIRAMFLETYARRNVVKATFRTASVISALVLGFVWAQDNIADGEWDVAAAKVSGATLTAWLFNRLLYARDPAAQALMARAPGAFGRWFQSAAKSNRAVNFLARDLNRALLIWSVKDVLMSGGGEGPSIPFDVIYDVDVDDESTWHEPDQVLLDLGFNIWYRQVPTGRWPQAAAGHLYLGKVEGSATTALLRALDIEPSQLPGLAGRLYQVVGPWHEVDLLITSVAERDVTEADKVYVLTTGERSGALAGGRGHHRRIEVVPANRAAVELFAGAVSERVPEYLLRPVLPQRGATP
ncbi:hypothetical protein [[Micrococcus luteus] ATCC 49442]|uniref:hypothetical protein n=1 Tax=[Micrococcus luteus] ATCC 49442 TaxID=2698727 RepID=UPI0013DCADFE|nr:hypothetical protein [[Micrococcus luteus] ATCC 49442]